MEKIIKKKLLLIVSMLAVTFALAGCSSSDKKVEFDYDGNTLVQIAETQATNYRLRRLKMYIISMWMKRQMAVR